MSSTDLDLICSDFTGKAPKEAVAMISDTVRLMIQAQPNCKTISFPTIRHPILKIILNYTKCRATEDLEKANAIIRKLYSDQNEMLYELCVAADYLNIKDLIDLTCEMVADKVKGKEPSEIRKALGIENVYTKEEEEEQRKEREAWPLQFR